MLRGYALVRDIGPVDRPTLERVFETDASPGVATEAVVVLSPIDQMLFARALLSPPVPTPALKRAISARRSLLRKP
jgi:uncharacterized protein (DUF1778 family)